MTIIIFLILFVIVILAFIGFCLYGLFAQSYMVKKSRRVDARVLSCEEILMTERDGNKFSYYLVTVDFYGDGEVIVKTFKSKKRYREGEIIPSQYLDKKDRLWSELDIAAKNRNRVQLLKIVGFLAVFLIAVLVIAYMKFFDYRTDQLKTLFGYFISIVFIGIGIYGISAKLRLKKYGDNMKVIDGTQVDYYIVPGRDFDDPSDYYPIYEFELNGKLQRYRSNIGGSVRKYRSIGRKVHILIDHETGKIMCKEDEKSADMMYILFGVIGVLVLCFMLAGSFGLL